MKIRILFLIALLCAAIGSLQSARATTITVNSTADPTESGKTTLRDALASANDGDTIDFSVTTPATITLDSGSGQLTVNANVTIDGPGADQLAVDANHNSRVFTISPGKNVTISDLTITNGSAADDFGGGIFNDHSTLTVNNCTISSNSAGVSGGGIYNFRSTLTVSNSTLSGNSATGGDGGGIFNDGHSGSATLTVSNSTFSGNSASSGNGGGILNNGESGSATLTVTNSTLSGNSAGSGGGIYNDNHFSSGSATLTIGHTILKAGSPGENIFNDSGTITSLGYNLSSDDASASLNATGDQNSTDPKLGPLQNNGGPTFTHQPLSDSPAIDAGDPALGMDQRGPVFPRVVNGRIDIGSVEVQATSTSVPAAPIASSATDVTSNSFTANWNGVSDATGYRLDVAKDSSFKGGSFVTGYHNLNVGNVTSRFVGGLNANTTYYYRVRAFNSNGVSPSSNVITVTTSP